jgi:G3E family GTPase
VEKTLEAVRIQAKYADLVILNKTDAAGTEELRKSEDALRRHNEKAPIATAVRGKITWDIYELAAPLEKEVPHEVSDTVPEEFFSFSLRLPGTLRRDCWMNLVEELEEDLLRGKGIVRYPEGPRFFEVVNHEYTEYPPPPGLAFEEENVIVLIRGTIGEGSLAERIKECLVETEG